MSNLQLSIQWHITTKCGHHCEHCYVTDPSTYPLERNNPRDYNSLIATLDSLDKFSEQWGVRMDTFTITGGDPLKSPYVFDLLEELNRRHKRVQLLGNPETLDEKAVRQLVACNIRSFQMSLDGMEDKHDSFRHDRGTFRRTIEKLELLESHGIRTNIMFTLFRENEADLLPLIHELSSNSKTSSFSFDIGVNAGSAKSLGTNFSSEEIRNIFDRYNEMRIDLQARGFSIRLGEKCHLFRAYHYEKGEYQVPDIPGAPITTGCSIGWGGVAILSDGSVLPCRRLPLVIGKLPEQSFEEIFLGSSLMRKFRRHEYYQECGSCELYSVCRGCPASVYGIEGDPFKENPFCFHKPKSTGTTKSYHPSPSINQSNRLEFDWMIARQEAISRDAYERSTALLGVKFSHHTVCDQFIKRTFPKTLALYQGDVEFSEFSFFTRREAIDGFRMFVAGSNRGANPFSALIRDVASIEGLFYLTKHTHHVDALNLENIDWHRQLFTSRNVFIARFDFNVLPLPYLSLFEIKNLSVSPTWAIFYRTKEAGQVNILSISKGCYDLLNILSTPMSIYQLANNMTQIPLEKLFEVIKRFMQKGIIQMQ